MRIVPAVLRHFPVAAMPLLLLHAALAPLRAQSAAAPAPAADTQSTNTQPADSKPGNTQPGNTQSVNAQPVTVDYTGSLLGYYRMEASDSTVVLQPVEKFLDFRNSASGKGKLLLGMGDNFGPEFGASLQLENDNQLGHAAGCYQAPKPTGDHESRPESLYKDDDRVALKAQCDNVLNFLMHAGFRAMVPGSQDFMYTARWLRSSALLLQDAGRDPAQRLLIENGDNRLDMLGANLRIAMKGRGAQGRGAGGAENPAGRGDSAGTPDPSGSGGPGGPGSGGSNDAGGGAMLCPLLFTTNPFARGTFRCQGDGTQPEPLDWLDRLDRLARSTSTVTALQALASSSAYQGKSRQMELDSLVHDEITIMASAWGLRFSVPALPPAAKTKKGQAAQPELSDAQVSQVHDALKQMSDCPASSSAGDQADMCVYRDRLVLVLESLQEFRKAPKDHSGIGKQLTLTNVERDAAIRGLLRTIAIEERNVGYTVATAENGKKVLVIGVAGEDTMQAVSETNLRLCVAKPGNWNGGDVFGHCGDDSNPNGDYSVLVTDPVQVTEALVRGASLEDGPFDSVVVMAQMPHTEAEVLSERVSTRLRLATEGQTIHAVDVVLSEAESGYGTPNLTVTLPANQSTYPAPVMTPLNSYSSEVTRYSYPGAVSELTLTSAPSQYTVSNQPDGVFTPPTIEQAQGTPAPGSQAPGGAPAGTNGETRTTIALLYELMGCLAQSPAQSAAGSTPGPAPGLDDCLQKPPAPKEIGSDLTSSQKAEFALLEDLQQAARVSRLVKTDRGSRPDVVLLQSRDVELDEMGPGYQGYEMCVNETVPEKHNLCMVRAALDRIFWKGDYLAYVAVTGKTLKEILTLSENKMAEQAELADTGFTREWLISYGIVQSTLTNVTEISRNNEPNWIPVDPTCKGDSSEQSTYCVGGTPIADDAYYWLLTTDQLAQDKATYGTLEALPDTEHQGTDLFITAPLSHYLLSTLHSPIAGDEALNPKPGATNDNSAEGLITYHNEVFQQRRLFQVDFSKIVASFTSRQPVGGNQFVGSYFQGVSDSRATAPGQQELDVEAANRFTANVFEPTKNGGSIPMSLGIQSGFSYDRSVQGNLTPATRPVNASYSLNNFTVGAFLQIRLHGRQSSDGITAVRSLPRSLLVITPRQYQVQINHQYLFFPFAPPPGELTVALPRNDVWTDRAGFREEFGQNRPNSLFSTGSYFETGLELSAQSNVLASLTLKTGANQKTCAVSADITLQTCFNQAPPLPINSSTTLVGAPGVKTLHSPGFYWQLHFQNHICCKAPNRQFSLVTDSQGDYYFGRSASAELPTQTEYAIPLSLSLLFPAMGNFSFAPSYSAFFYKSQLSDQSLQINSLSIAARWYFARDARVPIRRQARLAGPASADQTKTGKAH
jgi:hypothetical protein